MARPAIALERLGRDGDGLVVYELKRPFRDGATHVLCEPHDFISPPHGLVPRPKFASLSDFTACSAAKARHGRPVMPARSAPVSEDIELERVRLRAQTPWAHRLRCEQTTRR